MVLPNNLGRTILFLNDLFFTNAIIWSDIYLLLSLLLWLVLESYTTGSAEFQECAVDINESYFKEFCLRPVENVINIRLPWPTGTDLIFLSLSYSRQLLQMP